MMIFTYNKLFKLLNIFFIAALFLACSESIDTTSLKSISHTPQQDYLVKDKNTTISAIANYDDGDTEDISDTLTWSSSDESIATVEDGKISALATGFVTITYETQDTLPSGDPIIQNTIDFEVIDAQPTSLVVSSEILYKGETAKLSTNGIYTINASDVSLSLSDLNITSSETSIISVLENNLIQGIDVGTSTITVTDDDSGVSESISVEVIRDQPEKIRVSRNDTDYETNTFRVGEFMRLEAIATYTDTEEEDITQKVTWESSDRTIVTIDNDGEAEALKTGSVTVTATFDGIRSNELTLTVSN
jgi:uncharacterized protein YjdB